MIKKSVTKPPPEKTDVVILSAHNLSSFCHLLTIAVKPTTTVLHFWLIFFHSSCRKNIPSTDKILITYHR